MIGQVAPRCEGVTRRGSVAVGDGLAPRLCVIGNIGQRRWPLVDILYGEFFIIRDDGKMPALRPKGATRIEWTGFLDLNRYDDP